MKTSSEMRAGRDDTETDAAFHFEWNGTAPEAAAVVCVWAHGWGQNLDAFRNQAAVFPEIASLLIDFPGFGRSPPPPEVWGTEDYADACERLLTEQIGDRPVVWVGHSFGCRVGVQMATRYPKRISKMCLIAGAGLKRKRPLPELVRFLFRKYSAKILKHTPMPDALRNRLRQQMGSADYQRAGAMRGVFVRVVNEDLTKIARTVTCPTLLIYGENDTETPPEMGQRYSRLIPAATLDLLPGQDHLSVLTTGRHLVSKRLAKLLGRS